MGRRFKRNFRSAVIKIFSVIVHGKEEILLGIMNQIGGKTFLQPEGRGRKGGGEEEEE